MMMTMITMMMTQLTATMMIRMMKLARENSSMSHNSPAIIFDVGFGARHYRTVLGIGSTACMLAYIVRLMD